MTAQAQFGPQLHDGGVTFRIWAPKAKRLELVTDRAHLMQSGRNGWYEIAVPGATAGALYRFRIDGDIDVPDPASHFQPDDVCGPSEVIDHGAFRWRAREWRGRPWKDAAFVECHVGTFTQVGDFRSMIAKLDHIVECGITAIELMPLADFAGRWNWGYDGVFIYAPDSAYGRPEDLKTLIDEAHLRGLMVILDVVYNHFGPEGNHLSRYAPGFFTETHTPWGRAIDYDVPEVRAFAIQNALHWLHHYRFDGLRLDAIHAIAVPGTPSVLEELSRVVGEFAAACGRAVHLVLENENNDAALLDPTADPPRGRYRAQWNDDYHHGWHVLLTGESTGYYCDFKDEPERHIAHTLASGFSCQDKASINRSAESRGECSTAPSPLAFVNFLQNHDQIGNRPLGDRLTTQVPPQCLAAAYAITLLAPMPPLLFMGEEWGSTSPFPFFCDFKGDLAAAVRAGRREEFKQAYARYGDDIPDPLAEDTFHSAMLDWNGCTTPTGRERMALVKALLQTRRQAITPHLDGIRFGAAQFREAILEAHWLFADGQRLSLLANLSEREQARPQTSQAGRAIWGGAPPAVLPPWSVYWSIGPD